MTAFRASENKLRDALKPACAKENAAIKVKRAVPKPTPLYQTTS